METDCAPVSNQKNESMSNPNYNWQDITSEFFESIKGNYEILSMYLIHNTFL